MSEQIGWTILLGLVVAIVGIFILSSRVKKNLRETIEFMIRSNVVIFARLERRPGLSLKTPEEPLVGPVLERRHGPRRDPRIQSNPEDQSEQRRSAGRRAEDIRGVAVA